VAVRNSTAQTRGWGSRHVSVAGGVSLCRLRGKESGGGGSHSVCIDIDAKLTLLLCHRDKKDYVVNIDPIPLDQVGITLRRCSLLLTPPNDRIHNCHKRQIDRYDVRPRIDNEHRRAAAAQAQHRMGPVDRSDSSRLDKGARDTEKSVELVLVKHLGEFLVRFADARCHVGAEVMLDAQTRDGAGGEVSWDGEGVEDPSLSLLGPFTRVAADIVGEEHTRVWNMAWRQSRSDVVVQSQRFKCCANAQHGSK
jgi:hypothetical protein